jgi:TrmH family RNA methyltransferase
MITSKDNAKVQLARQLGRSKKCRYDNQLFILENKHIINEWLVQFPHLLRIILYTGRQNKPLTSESSVEFAEVDEAVFKTIPTVKTSSGCLAIVAMNVAVPTFNSQFKSIVLLDSINKPNNLGAIIRNAVAFDCDAIVLSKDCADVYHPETIRASAGSIHHLPIYRLGETIQLKDLESYTKFYLDPKAKSQLIEKTVSIKEVYIFGSEMGFNASLESFLVDAMPLSVEQDHRLDSLNVAVCSGIVLHHQFVLKHKSKKNV